MLRALQFLRLVDEHDKSLSLTSVILLASLVALIVTQSYAMLGAFIISVLLYAHKRKVSESYNRELALHKEHVALLSQVKEQIPAVDERIKRVEDGLVMIRNRIGQRA
jgi:hypothetical protein